MQVKDERCFILSYRGPLPGSGIGLAKKCGAADSGLAWMSGI